MVGYAYIEMSLCVLHFTLDQLLYGYIKAEWTYTGDNE